MNNFFTYAGKRSIDFGVLISGSGRYNTPERNVQKTEVPGKNGDLTYDLGNFKNQVIPYPAYIKNDMPDRIKEFANYMASLTGYQRLEDTYYPNEYLMARCITNIDVTPEGYKNRSGGFTISFDCKPQHFLKSGDEPVTFTSNSRILNRTLQEAKPLLRIYGTGAGTVGIGSETITISSISTYVDIDCEIMDAFKGSTNCNGNVEFTDDIVLKPGENGVAMTGNISRVDITPRWWII